MNQDRDSERNGEKGNSAMNVFQCPVCGGHHLSVIFEIYGMREVVGVKPDETILFGQIDEQGLNYGTALCPDCGWETECFSEGYPERLHPHLVDSALMLFTCPKCGGHELRRLRQGHITSYLVSAVYQDLSDNSEKVAVDMLDREDHGGRFGYGCGSCHCPLTDDAGAPISDENSLIEWLKNHQ